METACGFPVVLNAQPAPARETRKTPCCEGAAVAEALPEGLCRHPWLGSQIALGTLLSEEAPFHFRTTEYIVIL